MRGAIILASQPDFLKTAIRKARDSNLSFELNGGLLKIWAEDFSYVLMYVAEDVLDINPENRESIASEIWKYPFMFAAEFHGEVFFCNVIKAMFVDGEIIICSDDGFLFRPAELSPDKIAF